VEAVRRGFGGADVGVELDQLVDNVGGCQQVGLLVGAVPQDHALGAIPEAGRKGG